MGTDRHEITLSPSIFKGQQRRTGHRKRRGAFTRTASLSPDEPIPGHELLQRKDNSSPGPPSTSPSSVALPHLVPKDLSPCPGWGILTPFPFGRQRDKHEHVFAFRQTSRFGTDFSDPLGPTDPCSTAVHMEPFSSFSPQGSHLIFATTTKICTGGGSRRAHARHLQSTPPRPSYSLRRKPPRGKLCRSGPV
ncbi:hypothetical protein JTE90_010341 [Oedothorax gibbosus]|uniref:Uncharacterized protein n=1 Tax=Oedothorax gibbosus TaxID=931172 RepID=A0AAV6TE07_9ARAC|nr:hypothetical protein JTE90_010341 [Oedothorax gibbosus]